VNVLRVNQEEKLLIAVEGFNISMNGLFKFKAQGGLAQQ
jgi:hypothetical protein